VLLDDADPAISSASLPARLAAEHDITHLDVVIANAGTSSAFEGVLSSAGGTGTDPGEAMLRDFEVNAVGPARLFNAVWPLLDSHREEGKEKKFVFISSSLGSIGALEQENLPGVSYGMSKAAANWWAKKVSVELKGRLLVGIIHPG
jgi:NAD(P)-dependent dehydrogenase (short-subunit alcohol dehydrogenase family)